MKKLAREAKVSQPIISRFMSDDPAAHRDIRMEKTADRLAAFLGLELVPAKPKSEKSAQAGRIASSPPPAKTNKKPAR